MTQESAKGKLTLSGKSTLTLKNTGKSSASEGKKMVQVEVRKKRIVDQAKNWNTSKQEIDEATAQKLKLLADAKEHDAKRRQEAEAKDAARKLEQEKLAAQKLAEENEKKKAVENKKKAEMPADDDLAKKKAEEEAKRLASVEK